MKNMITKSPVGFTGLFVAIPALCLAVLPPVVIQPESENPKKLAETLVDRGVGLVGKLLDVEPAPSAEDDRKKTLRYFEMASVALGLLAAILAMFAWIRKENRRVAIAAAGVGAIAATWTYVIAGIVVVAALVIVGFVMAIFSEAF